MLNVKIIKSIQGTASTNEDIVGYRENYCWVIDGATDLFDCKDCYLICGNEIITDTRITEFSTENRKKIQKILENVSEDELPIKRLEIFRKTRLKANTSVGYPIGSLHFESVENILSGVLVGVTDFLMMSDGYYKYYDKDVTVKDTIRKIEMDSQQSLIYGKRDDATVLAGVLSDVY